MSTDICVVHLVWVPLGPAPLERFARSYREHFAGTDHRLLVVLNGFRHPEQLQLTKRILGDIPHESIEMPEATLDLAAYIAVARAVEDRYLCFLNSYCEILAPGWLLKMFEQVSATGAGLVGASGSYETPYSSPWIIQATLGRQFPKFPNPHIRTNTFMITRDLMLELDWPDVRTKRAALLLESGKRGLTRQVRARGLEALVVGRNGRGYLSEQWLESNTFRSGGQSNLLVADNRTRQFSEAEPTEQCLLSELAWGRPGPARYALEKSSLTD